MRITGPAAADEYKKRHQSDWISEEDSILAELIEGGYVEWDLATDKFFPSSLGKHQGTIH